MAGKVAVYQPWNLQQINNDGLTKGPAAVGDPFVCLFGEEQMHVAYRDGVGTIWDSWYDRSRHLWNLQKINAGGLTNGPAAVGGPFVWTVAGQQQHFTYRDPKGTIWDSWYNGPPTTYGGGATGPELSIYSVSIIDSSGNQIQAPIAGQAFTMSINIVNGGANAQASTLTVVMTPSDGSSPQTFSKSVPPIQHNGGAVVSISVPALTAGLTYDFNFYDPSTTQIGYESFQL